jgi:hypothetical protein
MGVVVWMRVFGGASFVRWSRSRLLPASRILLPSGRVPPSSGIRALGVRASSRHPTRALNHDHPSSHLDAITTRCPQTFQHSKDTSLNLEVPHSSDARGV